MAANQKEVDQLGRESTRNIEYYFSFDSCAFAKFAAAFS